MGTPRLDFAAIEEAAARIKPYAHRTPVLTCKTLDALIGAQLFFKAENFQKAGAFKFRGATNAVFALNDKDAARGVVTHSSGNHAGALALAGRNRGVKVRVVMPSNTAVVKRAAVEGYGAEVILCEPTLAAREATTAAVIERTGAVLVHPYDNLFVMAGQGTAALELLDDVPDLDVILAPLGGGGLLSGTLVASKQLRPGIRVFGCEPELADDGFRGLQEGKIAPILRTDTIADGLRTAVGQLTFPVIKEMVDGIALASEAKIIEAMRLLMERAKILVEPSSAVCLAAMLQGAVPKASGKIGIILSGGNVDVARLPFGLP